MRFSKAMMSKHLTVLSPILFTLLLFAPGIGFADNSCKALLEQPGTPFALDQVAIAKHQERFRKLLARPTRPLRNLSELDGQPGLIVFARLYWELRRETSVLKDNWTFRKGLNEVPLQLSPEERVAIQAEIDPLDPKHKLSDWLIDIVYGLSRKDIFPKQAPEHRNEETATGTWAHLLPDGYNTPYELLETMLKKANLHDGATVVDMGSGMGRLGILIGKKYPHLKYVGYEFWLDRIQPAMDVVNQEGLKNVRFVHADFATPDFKLVKGDLFFAYQPNSDKQIMAVMTEKLREVATQKPMTVVTRIGNREFLDTTHQFLIPEDDGRQEVQFWHSNPGFLGHARSRFSADIHDRVLTQRELDELNRLRRMAIADGADASAELAFQKELRLFSNKDLVDLARLLKKNWHLLTNEPRDITIMMTALGASFEHRQLSRTDDDALTEMAKSHRPGDPYPGLGVQDIIFGVPKGVQAPKHIDPYFLFSKIFLEAGVSAGGKFIDLTSGDIRPAVLLSKTPEFNFHYVLVPPSYYSPHRIKEELSSVGVSKKAKVFARSASTSEQLRRNHLTIRKMYVEGDVAFLDFSDPTSAYNENKKTTFSLLDTWAENQTVRFVSNASPEELTEGIGRSIKIVRSLSLGYSLYEIGAN